MDRALLAKSYYNNNKLKKLEKLIEETKFQLET